MKDDLVCDIKGYQTLQKATNLILTFSYEKVIFVFEGEELVVSQEKLKKFIKENLI